MSSTQPLLRTPTPDDGWAIYQLVKNSPPLDLNSTYLYLLQASHFAPTCCVAEINSRPANSKQNEKEIKNEIGAWVSGYVHPQKADTYFLWQVAVGSQLRGQGMAKQLIKFILQGKACQQVKFLETTITPDNQASWGLFTSLAQELNAPLEKSLMFSQEQLGGKHAKEILVRIGPFV